MFEKLLITPYTKYIQRLFDISFRKEWYETYWAFDLHGTIMRPSYNLNDKDVHYYPYAKEVLQILSKRKDIKLIMWTSSYPQEIEHYNNKFIEDEIFFDTINENPNISSNNGNFGYYERKFYFNILFDDKATFDPEIEWEAIYNLLIDYEKNNYIPNPNWTTKY